MKITYPDGKTRTASFPNACSGYTAKSIEITARDVRAMRDFAKANPRKFELCMVELERRFGEPTGGLLT